THPHVETMGLEELALGGSLVISEARELRRDFVDDRLSAARLRLLDQRGHFFEGALHLGCAARALRAEQGPRARQERVHLEEAAAALPRVDQGLVGQLECSARVALTELRLCQEAKCPRR